MSAFLQRQPKKKSNGSCNFIIRRAFGRVLGRQKCVPIFLTSENFQTPKDCSYSSSGETWSGRALTSFFQGHLLNGSISRLSNCPPIATSSPLPFYIMYVNQGFARAFHGGVKSFSQLKEGCQRARIFLLCYVQVIQ